MKLKTLKDFELLDEEILIVKLIKQEAIKDIKEIQNLEHTFLDKTWENLTGYKMVYSLAGKQAVINYIKWKNNLTEEDLK